MKKKIFSIVLVLALGLSIAFVGCGGNGDCECTTIPVACDCTPVAGCTCTAVTGCNCESIPAVCDCTHGNIGCNCTATKLPVIGLDDTFYFYDFGIRLFSVYFFESVTFPGTISFFLTNLGFSNININDLLRTARSENNTVLFHNGGNFTLAQGDTTPAPVGTPHNINSGYVWVGLPSGITLIPYMILDTTVVN